MMGTDLTLLGYPISELGSVLPKTSFDYLAKEIWKYHHTTYSNVRLIGHMVLS